jgi:hypothetical protein
MLVTVLGLCSMKSGLQCSQESTIFELSEYFNPAVFTNLSSCQRSLHNLFCSEFVGFKDSPVSHVCFIEGKTLL